MSAFHSLPRQVPLTWLSQFLLKYYYTIMCQANNIMQVRDPPLPLEGAHPQPQGCSDRDQGSKPTIKGT